MSENFKVKLGIAYASFLHDIGKIAQRAKVERRYVTTEIEKSLVQPGYGYIHVLFTQEFLEQETKDGHSFGSFFLPLGQPLADGTPEDTVQNLAARHHKPETPFQWLIAEGDRLSAGHDRKEGDEKDELGEEFQNKRQWYLRERSLSPFYVIDLKKGDSSENLANKPNARFEIRYFDGKSKNCRFPKQQEGLQPKYGEEVSEDYKTLYEKFCEEFENLFTENENKVEELSTFQKFLTLCERFYYTVPSSTIDMPDINLYDHSYLISALACALYDFHKENNSLTVDGVRDRTQKAFRIIQGDLSGIQNYILNFKHEGQTALAKTLRARSFYLQAISKDVERKILEELELPPTSVIVSAGSKFQILAPNVKKIDEIVKKLQNEVDNWLLSRYMGEISFLISASEPFSANELMTPKDSNSEHPFLKVMEQNIQKIEEKKFKKFESILKSNETWNPEKFIFHSIYEKYKQNGACAIHGKFPAEENKDDNRGNKVSTVAYEEKQVGTLLTHKETLSFTKEGQGALPFGNLKLAQEGDYNLLQNADSLKPSLSFLARLPEFENENKKEYEETYCKSCNEYKEGKCEILQEWKAKSFHCLAQESIHPTDGSGVSLLAVFKADVDNLGKIFQSGIPSNKISISRYSAISRSLNYFFTEYLHEVLQQEKYKNIYTVYAGGDDLFLLGPFPVVLEFAKEFRNDFTEYTGHHPELSFSAGVSFIKPRTPISIGAELAEEELSRAKKSKNKNSIGIFHEHLTWKEFEKALEISNKLIEYYKDKDEILSMGMLYRLLRYVRMYKDAKKNSKDIKQYAKNLMYASYFAYDKARNIYDKISANNTKKDQKLIELAKDLELWFTADFEESKRKILEFLDVAIQITMYKIRGGKDDKMVG